MDEALRSLLDQHYGAGPAVADPALEAALDELDRLCGQRLPDDYREFLRRRPCRQDIRLFGDFTVLCVERVIEAIAAMGDTREEVDADLAGHVDRRIRRLTTTYGRIPIAEFNGDVWLFLDFVPKRSGCSGQVIQVDIEALGWYWISASFDRFLIELGQGRVLDPDLGTEDEDEDD